MIVCRCKHLIAPSLTACLELALDYIRSDGGNKSISEKKHTDAV